MKYKIVKRLAGLAALCLCAFVAKADLPYVAVAPNNSILVNNALVVSNGVGTNFNSVTNIILTAAYQHDISFTTLITSTNPVASGTNTVGSGAFSYTNKFDLGKVIQTNGVSTTNWTTDTPIVLTGTGNGLTPVIHSAVINHTNFDGYELIRLTTLLANNTNNYTFTEVLGQTP